MKVIEFVFVACLVGSNPKVCKEHSLPVFQDPNKLTPQMCLRYGEMELVKWLKGHPKWQIAKFGCKRMENKNKYRKA